MNNATSLTRILILGALFTLGIVSLSAAPAENSTAWFALFIISKAAAAITLGLFAVLLRRWRRSDLCVAAAIRWATGPVGE